MATNLPELGDLSKAEEQERTNAPGGSDVGLARLAPERSRLQLHS